MLKNLIILLLAAPPACIWLYLFLRKRHAGKWLILFTFIGGMLAAKLILIYQGYWDETVNLIFVKVNLVDFRSNIQALVVNAVLSTFLIFLGVGVMEEYAKFWIMRFIDSRFLKSIDDAIELAIVSALGFAFYENVIYFSQNWGALSGASFIMFALVRVTVVTMVHMLCSGILGYYYGMAFFASPMLKIQYMKKKRYPVLQFLGQILQMKRSQIYHDQMFTIGLLISMVTHALYDFFLSIKWTLLGIPLVLPVMLIYFLGGFWFLRNLMQKKDLNLKLGLVGTHVMPKEDFKKLLEDITRIKEKMAAEQGGNI